MSRITLEWMFMILQRYLNQDHYCLEWLLQLSLHYIFLGNQMLKFIFLAIFASFEHVWINNNLYLKVQESSPR